MWRGFYCRNGKEGEGREKISLSGQEWQERKKERERERRWKGNPTNMQHLVAAAEDAICQDPKGRASTDARILTTPGSYFTMRRGVGHINNSLKTAHDRICPLDRTHQLEVRNLYIYFSRKFNTS